MGVDPGNKQTARIATDVSITTKSRSSRRLKKEVVGEDQQRDRSDDPDIAETVLRFIPFSAAHEESAVSFPSPQKQLRCTVHPDYASRRRHWLRWC
jgi:hypothetical protein